MPEKETLRHVAEDKRRGKSASTQAGEFVREEIHHIREDKHGARSPEQAIAIGLSKARRAGVDLPPPAHASPDVRKKAAQDLAHARHHDAPSRTRSHATHAALEHEGHTAASPEALSHHAHEAAAHRTPAERRKSSQKAARTRAHEG